LNKSTEHFDQFTVRYLIEDSPPLEIADANSPIREALQKMCSKKYSQLPVMKDQICIGSVTFESVMSQLKEADKKDNIGLAFMNWPVERFLEKNVRFVKTDDEILKHIPWMAQKGFVLVGSSQELVSIVTNYDIILFLKRKTQIFLLLREIETSLRFLISKCLGQKKLNKEFCVFPKKNSIMPSSINDLTLNQLRELITRNWSDLERILCDSVKVDYQIEKIRDLRNRVFHFRGHVTAEELDSIKRLRDNFINLAKSLIL